MTESPNANASYSILIVDDEPRNIQILGTILRENHYQFEFATSGEEALDWTSTGNFDLILLDVMMPGMDGFEVCQKIKAEHKTQHIPVIFLTAKTDMPSVLRGFEMGAVDYLAKPFNKQELLVRVKTHLELMASKQKLKYSYQQLEKNYTEIQTGYRKLEEFIQNKSQFLETMNAMNQVHFSNLRKKIDTLILNAEAQSIAQDIYHDLDTIEEAIRPYQSIYQTEKKLHDKHVLLAETGTKQRVIAKMALGGTGVELDMVSTCEEGLQRLENKTYDIICVDMRTIDLTQRAIELNPKVKTVFMTAENAPAYLPFLRKYSFLSNIVSWHVDERTFALKNIITTISKLLTNDFFGMEKYLNWGVKIHKHPITCSNTRSSLIDKMELDLEHVGVKRSIRSKCGMVAEELIMNAIYDAPIDAKGKMIYNHLPRTQQIDLKNNEQGLFSYACDGFLVAISVEDPFGGFHRETILDYLESCYKGETFNHQKTKGGAGRGLFYIMEIADLVVFNVKSHIRTEVMAIFNIDPNKSKQLTTTSFHFFHQN